MTIARQTLDSDGNVAGGSMDRAAVDLRRSLACALVGLLWCAAVLVGWRRLAGALERPLNPAGLLLLGLVVVAAAVGIRSLWHRLPTPREVSWLKQVMLLLLPTLAVLMLGAAVSVQGTNTGGLVAFWALLAAGELWAWQPIVRQRPSHRPETAPAADPPPTTAAVDRTPSENPLPAESPWVIPADDVLQQLTRSQAANGSEQLAGWLRAPFAAGQRTTNVHVAFCPPFAKTPQVSAEQLDGPSVRVKTAQLLAHGVRLDLKLASAADTTQTVLLQFTARSNPES